MRNTSLTPVLKVSVVLCTYNGAAFLREQIDSIINQTYPIFELLIADDCSTDETWNILESYAEKNSIIRIYRNEKNIGLTKNFFTAFEKATGDFIAVSDQDDIWYENKIERMLTDIGDNLLVFAKSKIFTSKFDISLFVHSRDPHDKFLPLVYVSLRDTISGHNILFKKELLDYMLVSFKTNYWYDFSLAITAIAVGKIAFSDCYLTLWRRHPQASTYTPYQKKHTLRGYIEAVKIFFSAKERTRGKLFYQPILSISCPTARSYTYIRLLAENRLLKAAIYTFRNREEFFLQPNKLINIVRSLFVPLFAYRNIKDWNSMQSDQL